MKTHYTGPITSLSRYDECINLQCYAKTAGLNWEGGAESAVLLHACNNFCVSFFPKGLPCNSKKNFLTSA